MTTMMMTKMMLMTPMMMMMMATDAPTGPGNGAGAALPMGMGNNYAGGHRASWGTPSAETGLHPQCLVSGMCLWEAHDTQYPGKPLQPSSRPAGGRASRPWPGGNVANTVYRQGVRPTSG